MAKFVKIADKTIGDGYPCFIIAEIVPVYCKKKLKNYR